MQESISFDQDLRDTIKEVVQTFSKAVKSTLGPAGTNVGTLSPLLLPVIVNDGVTVAKSIKFQDPLKKYVANILKTVSQGTDNAAGDGPQPMYSKVLTPSGFVEMGSLKLHQKICGTENSTQVITGIYPKGDKEVYKLTLSDGRVIECCENHNWQVVTNYGKEKTLTTKQLIDSGKISITNKKGHTKYGFYIPKTFVGFEEQKKDIIIDPYLLGLLIGDGSLSGTGNIELSIGKEKFYVLDKIVLPTGVTFNYSFYKNKNYYRVVFKGLRPIIKNLGLLGSKSNTKFIPKTYLYSSLHTRYKLLEGLLDTDGHINKRGLYEYSTVSDILMKDFLELSRGLGHSVEYRLHDRRRDSGSYSNNSIHRIVQLKGFKYGHKIKSIEATGRFTDMQCIKVSNSDNLYVTDNYVLTHNTTTSTTLAESIILEGIKNIDAGFSQVDIVKGIREATILVLKKLEEKAIPVTENNKMLLQVASVSANNDKELGKIISEAFTKVGVDGQIEIKDSTSEETYIEVVAGMKYDSGFESNMFTNNDKSEAVLDDCRIFIYEGKLMNIDSIMSLITETRNKNESLLIIADDYDKVCVDDLAAAKLQHKLKVCAVKSPGYGKTKESGLEDIALITNSKIVSKRFGITLDSMKGNMVGKASSVKVNKDSFTIIEDASDTEKLKEKIKDLKIKIKSSTGTEKQEILNRIANLSSGVAVMYVTGNSPVEIAEKKYRIEDAVNATRASLEEGVVPGGGVTLLRLGNNLKMPVMENRSQEIGFDILVRALQSPIKTISSNSGENGDVVMNEVLKSKKFNYGYNAKTKKYTDLVKSGVLDPVKVTKAALTNASSVSQLLLTMNCAIYE